VIVSDPNRNCHSRNCHSWPWVELTARTSIWFAALQRHAALIGAPRSPRLDAARAGRDRPHSHGMRDAASLGGRVRPHRREGPLVRRIRSRSTAGHFAHCADRPVLCCGVAKPITISKSSLDSKRSGACSETTNSSAALKGISVTIDRPSGCSGGLAFGHLPTWTPGSALRDVNEKRHLEGATGCFETGIAVLDPDLDQRMPCPDEDNFCGAIPCMRTAASLVIPKRSRWRVSCVLDTGELRGSPDRGPDCRSCASRNRRRR
jgi:hypothetical protein